MKKIQILGLALVAVFAFSAVAATAAFAAHEFLLKGLEIKESQLKIANVLSETGPELLLLEDMKGGIFGEGVDLLCSGFNLGEFLEKNDFEVVSIWPLTGSSDPGTGAVKVKCETMSGICGEPEAVAVHLPWLVEVILNAEELFRGLLLGTGAGNPGWNVICNKAVEDECSAEETTVGLANEGNNVDSLFDSKTAPGNCTRGGAKEGLVEGLITFSSETGEALGIS
jgi:hypothetical protein